MRPDDCVGRNGRKKHSVAIVREPNLSYLSTNKLEYRVELGNRD